jgi:hypothetical protein
MSSSGLSNIKTAVFANFASTLIGSNFILNKYFQSFLSDIDIKYLKFTESSVGLSSFPPLGLPPAGVLPLSLPAIWTIILNI